MDELLTVKQVSEILHTNTDYVYKLLRSGILPFLKIGGYKCRVSTLNKFLADYEGKDITDPCDVKPLLVSPH